MSQMISKIVTRRNFMRLAVAGAGTAAVGLYYLNEASHVDYTDPAYLYWKHDSQGALNLTRYLALCGSLAPSPHNTQPWRFVTAENEIRVYADRSRNLGRGDADFRMLLMSIGAAIENISISANHLGHDAVCADVADGQFNSTGLCANVTLAKQSNPGSQVLFDSIFKRQTTRSPYLNQPVSGELTQRINQMNDSPFLSLHWYDRPPDRKKMADLHAEAVRKFVATGAYQDSLKWWRMTRNELLNHRDGISIYTSCASGMTDAFFQYGVVDQTQMSGASGQAGEIAFADKLSNATPLWGAIVSSQTGDRARVDAGRLLERVYLEATRQNYGIMPVAYVSEQTEFAARMKDSFNIPRQHELMTIFRIGKGESCERSVRRPVSEVVSEA